MQDFRLNAAVSGCKGELGAQEKLIYEARISALVAEADSLRRQARAYKSKLERLVFSNSEHSEQVDDIYSQEVDAHIPLLVGGVLHLEYKSTIADNYHERLRRREEEAKAAFRESTLVRTSQAPQLESPEASLKGVPIRGT